MKFSYSWIVSYVPGPAPDPKALGERLTAVGFIVECVEGTGAQTVYDVEITANRPDAMNHRGLAREAAIALNRAFREPTCEPLHEGETPADARARVLVEEPELCSRYSARVLEGIRVRPASGAVRDRLLAIGSGAISAPVDATNHVLWDIGQPLHAFDLDTLAKGANGLPTIVVRRAKAGESLVTLDGVSRTLTSRHLVIADAERPVALAGVMGGLATAISEKTTRVLLESAHFDPRAVRKTARSVGMHTDASHRFERGTDPEATRDGLDRAARLILADCGGTLCRGTIDVRAGRPAERIQTLRLARLAAFLGMDIPAARCLEILAALGFSPIREGDAIRVTVPSWRVDVAAEEDLIEEIIRCEGYDRLPETLPRPYAPARPAAAALVADRARDLLVGFGLLECQTYSFVSSAENLPFESAAPGSPVLIENALGEPFTTMRATPVIGLLQSAQHNARRGQRDLALFEVGTAFGWNPDATKEQRGKEGRGRVLERKRVGILLAGLRRRHWSETSEENDFFEGAGVADALMKGLGLGGASAPITFEEDLPSYLAPGRAARILCSGRECGWIGVLEPSLAATWDLTDPVVADLDLDLLGSLLPPPVTSVEPPARFPGSEVDLTATHPVATAWKTLEVAVRADAPVELVAVTAKGRYRGAGVPEGFVKTTLTLRFLSPLRSLAREDVNAWRDLAARRLLTLPAVKVDGVREGS
jgi:phenylalanyl-tRNA synthetase beta chain